VSRSVLLKLLGGTKSPAHLRRWINLWPPFLGMGIRIVQIATDMKAVDVEMKLRWWNANYVGTHFGGSLFAMTDAFYMLMLMANLGRDYIVWDLSALRLRDQTLPTRSLRGKLDSFVNRMQSSPFTNLSGTVSKSWCTIADASNGGV
jgi:hypothetical protein